MQKKNVYFLSDFHLGAPNYTKSIERERLIVNWLLQIEPICSELYLVGDVFDFWFEYKHTVPKNHIRLLGTLAKMADNGIKIHYFTGNHDMWMFGYLEKEIGLTLYKEPIITRINGLTFYIGHGDGLGPNDFGYKFLKKIFNNKICQWLFARLHPNFAFGLAQFWSQKSRKHSITDGDFLEEKEWLVQFSRSVLKKQDIDYFIFGHRHFPINYPLNNKSSYINLGDWINHFSYGVLQNQNFSLGSCAASNSITLQANKGTVNH